MSGPADYRWAGSTSRCLCGSANFLICGGFDEEGNLAWWGLDATCSQCDAKVRVPHPHPPGEESMA